MKTVNLFLVFVIVFFSSGSVWAQTISISGFIINEKTGDIIKNASVFEKGEGIGTISNSKGFFKLILTPGEKRLQVSDSGFKSFSKVLELKQDTILTVGLLPENTKHIKRNEAAGLRVANDDELSSIIPSRELRNRE